MGARKERHCRRNASLLLENEVWIQASVLSQEPGEAAWAGPESGDAEETAARSVRSLSNFISHFSPPRSLVFHKHWTSFQFAGSTLSFLAGIHRMDGRGTAKEKEHSYFPNPMSNPQISQLLTGCTLPCLQSN